MVERKSSYSYEDLISCAHGTLFGPGNPRLPLPPLLMMDRITHISDSGGEHGKGEIIAEMAIRPDLWFFGCHFEDDPVMPGCLGVDALWQLLGFFLGWLGGQGLGRALGAGAIKFTGQVLPNAQLVTYHLNLKRVVMRRLVMGVAEGRLAVDGETVYVAEDMRVGLFQPDGAGA